MPQFVKWLLACSLLLCIAMGASWLGHKSQEPHREPAGKVAEGAPLPAWEFRPEEKQRYIYRFSRKLAFHGLDNKIPDITYHGEFHLEILHSGSAGFEALVSEKIAEHPEGNPLVARIHLSVDGKRLEIFTEKISAEEDLERLNVLRDLLANWVFPLEADTVGNFSARFDAPSQENGLKGKKTKLSYLASLPAKPEILRSENSLVWSEPMAMPQELRGEEETRLGQGGVAINAISEYSIVFWKKEACSPGDGSRLAESAELGLAAGSSAMGNPEHQKLRWASILADLQGLSAMSGGEQLRVFGDLTQYLKMHPEALSNALNLLGPDALAAGPKSELFKVVVGALATSGSPAAQAALINLYQDPSASVGAKGSILSAITTTQASMDMATRQFLTNEMNNQNNSDLANGAGFALGAALQNAPNDAASATAIQSVQSAWQQAVRGNNMASELNILDVMGNSGKADFFSDIQAVVQSNDASALRARAEFALRYIPGSAAASLLASGLGDADTAVRAAAAQAMQVAPWQEAFRAPLQNCVNSETQIGVKEVCQAVLQQANSRVAQQ